MIMSEADVDATGHEDPDASESTPTPEAATDAENALDPNLQMGLQLPSGGQAEANELHTTHVHTTQPTSSPLDEERIAKAASFLRSSEIRDVPTEDKRRYLASRAGLTPGEIDAALERAAASEGLLQGAEDAARREGYGRYRDDGFRDGRRGPNQYEYSPDPYSYDARRGHMGERRPPQQHYPPPDNMPPHMHSHPEREETAPPPSLLPAWAGGFSMGVVCLAALRWLNGGDFVLFPSPTASEAPAVGAKRGGEPLSNANEEETDESESQQEELLEENEEEYEEYEPEEEDGLDMILNGTADAQTFHPNEPSYHDLVLEIRSLASAVHSYRDVQERATRAATAHAGRGVTNDAMDFLRRKRASDVGRSGVDEKDAATVAGLLVEMSGELTQLKKSIAEGEEGSDGDDGDAAAETNGSNDDEGRDTADAGKDGTEDPSIQIDMVLEKIQKILAIVESKKDEKEEDEDDTGREHIDEVAPIETKSPNADGQATSTEVSPTTSVQGDEKVDQNEEPEPQQNSEPEEATATVEEALQKLSTNNDPAELKLGAQMLYLYCLNISNNPTVPRYRKIYTNNNTYRTKVGNLVGAKEFLRSVGFVERTNCFEWAGEDGLMATKSRLDFALVALELMKSGSNPKEEVKGAPSETGDVVQSLESADLTLTMSLPDKAMDLN